MRTVVLVRLHDSLMSHRPEVADNPVLARCCGTELSNRMIGAGTNALASSIVLVCRQRAATAPTAAKLVIDEKKFH